MRPTTYLVILAATGVPVIAQGSSLAPMHAPRCSQTSFAAVRRMVDHPEMGNAMFADVMHLFPHMEIGFAPIEARSMKQGIVSEATRHVIVAAKPSITTCFLELHMTAELDFNLAHAARQQHEGKNTLGDTAWRLGIEGFFRPTRWLPESWRPFDALALGVGVLAGDAFENDMKNVWKHREIELGPRLLFDVSEWLAFIFSVNACFIPGMRTEAEYMKMSALGSVQLSFPSHAVFGDSHASH